MIEETPQLHLLNQVVTGFGGTARKGQQQMVDTVAQALEKEQIALIQAGTGTGKSFGYLVPVMQRVAETKERVIISTATLALQRQILEKDAPQVNQHFKHPVKVAALKGWNNYLCLHKLTGGYAEEYTLFDADFAQPATASTTGKEIVRLREWAANSETGDRDDLVPGVSDQVWRRVSVPSNECLGATCPLRDECFPALAREEAAGAKVVITNHAMLGIHATSENKIVGEFDALVVDEAHDLQRIVHAQATLQLHPGAAITKVRWAGRLLGLDVGAVEAALSGLETVLANCSEGLIRDRADDLIDAMRLLDSELRNLVANINSSDRDAAEKKLASGVVAELSEFMDAWDRPVESMITWVTMREDETMVLNCVPLDVSGPIAYNLFAEKAVVLTSATLKLGGSFAPLAAEVGVYRVGSEPVTVDVGSPFDAAKQGILYVAADLPAPARSGLVEEQLNELLKLTRASDGGMLGLFSSRRAVLQAAEFLREHLDYPILVQGEDQLSNLVNEFREDFSSCLLGTMTLWQGIDIKGPNCRLVVIDRIPFPVPSDPVVQARNDEATRRGQSAFQVVSLSHAALLMAQGAGRLLRSVDDRGMVAILDSRLARKSYGGFIRSSLPAFWPTQNSEVAVAAMRRLAQSLAVSAED